MGGGFLVTVVLQLLCGWGRFVVVVVGGDGHLHMLCVCRMPPCGYHSGV